MLIRSESPDSTISMQSLPLLRAQKEVAKCRTREDQSNGKNASSA
jgi:hypothetical protein